MSFEKILYKYEEPHGIGDVYFIWQKALLATTGTDGSVALYNRQGQLVQRIILSGWAMLNLYVIMNNDQ